MDLYTIIFILLMLTILWFILHYFAKPTVPISDRKNRHLWKNVASSFDRDVLLFCNICENLTSQFSFFCEYCSVTCDKVECTKTADSMIKCKQQRDRNNSSNQQSHHYLKGNLLEIVCSVCKLSIEGVHDVGIHSTKCIWCHKSFHDSCAKPDLICDFGKLKDVIIPPFSVKACRTSNAPKLHLKEITKIPEWQDWQPLIVIFNEASGSTEIHEIATLFRRLLNPIQVISLSNRGPIEALEIVKLCPVNCRLLVCGGDGTVAWTLNTIKEMNLDDKVTVAICPQGTGNDLSRILNWGSEINHSDLETPFALLDQILSAETVKLDRWQIVMKYDHRTAMLRRLHHDKKMFMYNYCSIGVDALVTLNFHKARQSAFYLIKSKIINKLLYFVYGTQQVIKQDCDALQDDVEVSIDGIKQELPELQSVIMLNIDSWGAGCKLIEMIKENDKSFAEAHSISDKLIEVFGVSSSFHIAQLQVGLTKPLKIGRAKEVKIKLKKVLPIQIDGEPHFELPCEITITPHSQAKMLKKISQ